MLTTAFLIVLLLMNFDFNTKLRKFRLRVKELIWRPLTLLVMYATNHLTQHTNFTPHIPQPAHQTHPSDPTKPTKPLHPPHLFFPSHPPNQPHPPHPPHPSEPASPKTNCWPLDPPGPSLDPPEAGERAEGTRVQGALREETLRPRVQGALREETVRLQVGPVAQSCYGQRLISLNSKTNRKDFFMKNTS